MKKYYLRPVEFDYFKKRISYWANRLGSIDTRFHIERRNEKDPNVRATYREYKSPACVWIWLNSVINEPYTKALLDQIAYHEIFEITFLAPLRYMALDTYNLDTVDEQVHVAINKAMNCFYKDLRGINWV